jgi:nucleotide-binding universal stress UspA family protein
MSEDRAVVLGYDDSDSARHALSWVIRFARTADATVHVVHVVPSSQEWTLAAAQIDPDPLRHTSEDLLAHRWTAPLRDADVEYRAEVVVGDPVESLLAAADADHAELIAVGASHHGLIGEVLTGSVALGLLHRSRIPMVVVP